MQDLAEWFDSMPPETASDIVAWFDQRLTAAEREGRLEDFDAIQLEFFEEAHA